MKINVILVAFSVTALVLTACTETGQNRTNTAGNGRQTVPTADQASKVRLAQEARHRAAVASKQGHPAVKPAYRYHSRPRLASPGYRYPARPGKDRENYAPTDSNPVKRVVETPVSTFSIDVDTGSYSNIRRFLNMGRLPPPDAVRIEELVNYFSYDYKGPKSRKTPFSVKTEIARTPWNNNTYLLHIGIKGYDIPRASLPASNLVFLIDVSGSMHSPRKLGLLKSSLKLLTRQLDSKDRVSIVVYAGASGVVLEPTPGDQKARIIAAIDRLHAGGSTNGGAGIHLAYLKASEAFIKNGINRVILATDGDFNVGTVNFRTLKDMVARKRKTGISLTTLGFGAGNYNDRLMEQLADAGNGNHAYIDTLNEARKVLVSELSSTLFTIAKDVKIQIEFNPSVVSEYRLIGYVNRKLRREDFRNDKVDAGEIGSGHTVTAIYEIALVGGKGNRLPPLRYGVKPHGKPGMGNELAFLKMRYKKPGAARSVLRTWRVLHSGIVALDKSSPAFRFSAAVAAFGQKLRGGRYLNDFSYEAILKLAGNSRGTDEYGYRGEFLSLVRLAQALQEKPVKGAVRRR